MKPAPFDYLAPASADEAVRALSQHGDDAKVLAGGQSLVPMLNFRLARPGVLVDVNGVRELDYLRQTDDALVVGALRRQRALERWAATASPLFADVMRWVSHVAIRTRGTVAGSIAHADPAAELPAVLLALDGTVVARGAAGERVIRAADFFRGPLTTSLRTGELVTEVRFPRVPAGAGFSIDEVARRHGDFALVGALALLWREDRGPGMQARLAFFGVSDTPVRSREAEAILAGQEPTPARLAEAARAAAAALAPDSDLHATAEYRRRVAAVLAERTLRAALARARPDSGEGPAR
jgi:carbon-monoxide dehydrogenase medium subunit